MDELLLIVQTINSYLSNYVLIVLLIGTGLFFTIRTRFVQVRCFGEGLKRLFGGFSLNGEKHKSGMSSFQAVATAIAGYGLYAFYRRQIGDYLIMRMHFVFYDYEKGIFPFLLDYLAVMILIAFIGYYSGVFLKKTGKRKRKGSY